MKHSILIYTVGLATLLCAGCEKPADTSSGADSGAAHAGADSAAHDGWMVEFEPALAKARAENKLLLMDFTGSDWCPPCMALAKNIFASDEFKQYAEANLVLLELDFPRRKEQSAERKTANQALSEKYDIEGFPTVIVLNGEGKELNRDVGFGGQSPTEYVARIEALKKK